ncbi:MAG TPA: exo-alpha-sialidase [Verrucomicrobiae bacterium]|nr:exo-alpha-sialidase [Verrucomicrobiae bacterium]
MGETVLLIGTRKGLVVARSRDDRRSWSVDDIHFVNLEVYSVAVDARRDPVRLFAAAGSGHWGPQLAYSDDLGRSWVEPEVAPIAFPAGTDTALVRVWQIQPAPESQPDVVFAGVEPHALFRSSDGGITFSLMEGLWNHPHRAKWTPGNGGACLHTILTHPTDPKRLWVAMSAAGVYRSSDGGASWDPTNRGIQAYWLPEDQRFPEFGQCVHRLGMHPDQPDRLYAQNHFGVYRSDDAADSWHPIESDLPSTFGFPMVVHPRRPGTIFSFPLQGDGERMPPGARCRVYRSQDAGASWQPLSTGLPQSPYYAAVLRDAMTADSADPVGIYFGTRVGEVYATRDDGDSWELVVDHLPDVFSVRAATLA